MADQFAPDAARKVVEELAKINNEKWEKRWERLVQPKHLAFSGLSYTSNATQPANYVSAAQIVGASSGQS